MVSSKSTLLLFLASLLLLPSHTLARLGSHDEASDSWRSHPSILIESETDAIDNEFILVTNNAPDDIRAHIEHMGGTVLFTYEHVFSGLAIRGLDPSTLVQVMDSSDDGIVYATPNQQVTGSKIQDNPPLGLDRIDEKSYPLNQEYEPHGRSKCSFNAIDYETCNDLNYHGTHAAGIIGGKTFGVAKKAALRSVKVLDGSGYGTWAGVLAGLDHVLGAKLAKPDDPMVVNISLGGGFSSVINDALDTLVATGIVAVVAAGNEHFDACAFSPASASAVITVGATSMDDKIADFSNQGPCVDVLAPGVDIPSSSAEHDYAIRLLGGTSMASPHVAGAEALYLQKNTSQTQKKVLAALLKRAVPNMIDWVYEKSGTRNLMLSTKDLV